MPGVKLPLPIVPGCDGIGEIVRLGEGVTHLRPGPTRVGRAPASHRAAFPPHDLAGNDQLSDDYKIRGEHFDGLDQEYVTVLARFRVAAARRPSIRSKPQAVPLVFPHPHGACS